MNFKDFRSGNRCPVCSGNKRKTIEEVRKEAQKDGTICISDTYVNWKSKLDMVCPHEHPYKITWNDFKSGYRCPQCAIYNISGENHYKWKSDRTRSIRSEYLKFNHKNIKILYDEPLYKDLIEYKKIVKRNRKHRHEVRNIYEVDHIFPRIAFIDNNLDKDYDLKLIQEICNSRDNLRIILNIDNNEKAGKYNQEEFIDWFNLKLQEIK